MRRACLAVRLQAPPAPFACRRARLRPDEIFARAMAADCHGSQSSRKPAQGWPPGQGRAPCNRRVYLRCHGAHGCHPAAASPGGSQRGAQRAEVDRGVLQLFSWSAAGGRLGRAGHCPVAPRRLRHGCLGGMQQNPSQAAPSAPKPRRCGRALQRGHASDHARCPRDPWLSCSGKPGHLLDVRPRNTGGRAGARVQPLARAVADAVQDARWNGRGPQMAIGARAGCVGHIIAPLPTPAPSV
mmetsp:Transcript_15451/g.58510  ORF Transcript_15451/g.58510 Transcript_15451/m.58510 type:complete len:241 (-) Transcript_15451:2788-3510(-)